MKVLRITARPEKGFRRCGVHHPPSPVDHPIDRFGKDERKILEADPNLVVVEADVPDAPQSGAPGESHGASQPADDGKGGKGKK